MPQVVRTFKTRIDPATGKRVRVLDERGRPIPHEKYRFVYTDYDGRQRWATGTTSLSETRKLAREREKLARLGLPPLPPPPVLAIDDVIEEYLDWGAFQGGRRGGWSLLHARIRSDYLQWWKKALSLKNTADLDNILPRVEAILRELEAKGKADATINNKATALKAFCRWAARRKYLPENPLRELRLRPVRVRNVRRALTAEEVERLLRAAKPNRRLLYEVALTTGLRAGELRGLLVRDLDRERPILHIRAELSKSRTSHEVYLPRAIWEKLLIETEGKKYGAWLFPEMPSTLSQVIRRDLKKAGIPWKTEEGKVDFHALRVAYITFVIETGADIKTCQTLARHSNPTITFNTYGRARRERLEETAEGVFKQVFYRTGKNE